MKNFLTLFLLVIICAVAVNGRARYIRRGSGLLALPGLDFDTISKEYEVDFNDWSNELLGFLENSAEVPEDSDVMNTVLNLLRVSEEENVKVASHPADVPEDALDEEFWL